MKELCLDKQCTRKGELLPLTDFPRDRRRENGRYIYCKACCVRRERERRAAKGAREYKRRELGIIDREPERISYGYAFSLVYEAINRGVKYRDEIHEVTGVDYDTLGLILCELWEVKGIQIRRLPDGKRQWISEGIAA